jgi:hypothetical protein
LYEYESWSLALRKEHRLRGVENRVLRKICRKFEVTENCITWSFIIFTVQKTLLG